MSRRKRRRVLPRLFRSRAVQLSRGELRRNTVAEVKSAGKAKREANGKRAVKGEAGMVSSAPKTGEYFALANQFFVLYN